MAEYRPQSTFTVPLRLLIPTVKKENGVEVKSFPAIEDGILFFASFKSYGGTERDVNGIFSIEDTADIETWYDPRITSKCNVALADTGEVYEILGVPENINRRNMWLKFKVRRTKGGA